MNELPTNDKKINFSARQPVSLVSSLWKQRPAEVTQQITHAWTEMQSETPQRASQIYSFVGASEYKFGPGGMFGSTLSTTEMLTALLQSRSHRPLRVLDIGTGNGDFLLDTDKKYNGTSKEVTLLGMSAHDLRSKDKQWPSTIDFLQADAERFDQANIPANSLDLIVSRTTAIHFADPIGTLAQWYEALAPEGMIVVDEMVLEGMGDHLISFVQDLQMQGYPVVADYRYRLEGDRLVPTQLEALIIQKTAALPTLDVPVTYAGYDSAEYRAIYSYTPGGVPDSIALPPPLGALVQEIRNSFTNPDAFLDSDLVINYINNNGINTDFPLQFSFSGYSQLLSLLGPATQAIDQGYKSKQDFRNRVASTFHLPL